MKKAIASVLLVAVFLVSSGFLYIANAQADKSYKEKCLADTGLGLLGDKIIGYIASAVNSALSFLSFGLFGGGKQETNDQNQQTITLKADLKNCIKYVTDTIFDAALANFKKRLLDKMTDDVVNWIKNGEEPRFVSDFGGFLEETTSETLGKTAEDIGLGQLCSGSLSARLQLQLESPPPFTQSVNCTLNDIIRNVGNFDRDFRSGGWIGYNEILKPQNNRWGLELITQDQIAVEQNKKIESARNEVVSSGGYTSEKQCIEWTRAVTYGYDDHSEEESIGPWLGSPDWDEAYYNPRNTPPAALPGGVISATGWKCKELQVTIPGRTVGELAGGAIKDNDPLLVANTDDLTPYITAIFDAAINRLFKEGVRGLRGDGGSTAIYSESGTGRAPQSWATSSLYAGYGQEFGNSSNPIEKLKSEIRSTIASTTQIMRVATSSLLSLIQVGGAHWRLVASTTALVACENTEVSLVDPLTGFLLSGITCPKTVDVVKLNTDRETAIRNSINSINELVRQPDGLLIQARNAVDSPNISEVTLISILAGVSQAYSQIANIRDGIPGIIAEISRVASTTVNPWLRSCRAAGTYSCPL